MTSMWHIVIAKQIHIPIDEIGIDILYTSETQILNQADIKLKIYKKHGIILVLAQKPTCLCCL